MSSILARSLYALLLPALPLVLASCSSVAIPYRTASYTTGAPVSVQADPKSSENTKPAPSGRYKNLDRAMEMQVGTALFANFDTVLRLDSPALGVGVPISFEDDLGFDDRADVFRLDLRYRLGRRHRFEFSSFSITRRANWKLQKEIEIGGVVYPINLNVTAVLTTNIYKGTYRYLFAMGDRWDVSASAGLHTLGLGFDLSEDATSGRATSESFTLPLPVFGLGGNYAFSEKLKLNASAELFGIKFDNFSGYLMDLRLSLDWDIWDHVGVGLGWNGFLMDIEIKDKFSGGDLLRGSFVYKYQGALIYLRMFF